MQKFDGSEKQVKWANDIIASAKKDIESELNRLKYEVEKGWVRQDELDDAKILSGIVTDVLSNISSVWSAKDVIDNRYDLGDWTIMGIKRRGSEIRLGSESYSYSDFKDSATKEGFEKKVFEYLKAKNH